MFLEGFERLHAEVSITARPFFEAMGFRVVRDDVFRVRGAELQNYIMEKSIATGGRGASE